MSESSKAVETSSLHADRPISDEADDLLERGPLVGQLARWVRHAPIEDGFVIGLAGPWGSGKTSILQLLATRLQQDATVIWFDPWLFSGADQLVLRFFEELAKQLASGKSRRFRDLSKRVADYGAALAPVATVALGSRAQALAAPKSLFALRQGSASTQRDALRSTLLTQSQRIVVLIDDIDRLDAQEIREVLRLVKLVADLPGVVHVLSFDRKRVERALEQSEGDDGHAQLEKIVQASARVPPVPKDELRRLTLDWLGAAVGDQPLDAWDDRAWSALIDGGIDGYLHTLRDGRRFANVALAALELCAGEVASMDVLALDAMRLFDPDVHESLPTVVDILTGNRDGIDFRSQDQIANENRRRINALLEVSRHVDATRTLLRELFPMAAQFLGGHATGRSPHWQTRKRVASRPVLMHYLHLVLPATEVPASVVDHAVLALEDARLFREVLRGVEDERLDDLLDRTRLRLSEQRSPDVVGCALALTDIIPRMRERRGFFDVEPERRVQWLISDLVRSLDSQDERMKVAQRLVERAPTLSLRVQWLYRFRIPEEPSGEPELDLLDHATFAQLHEEIAADVDGMAGDQLARESHLWWLLGLLGDASGPDRVLGHLRHAAVLRAVLESVGTEVRPLVDAPGVSVRLRPLVKRAGEPVLDLLRKLIAGDALKDDLRAALKLALERWSQTE